MYKLLLSFKAIAGLKFQTKPYLLGIVSLRGFKHSPGALKSTE